MQSIKQLNPEQPDLHEQKQRNAVINADGDQIVKRCDEGSGGDRRIYTNFLEKNRNKRSVKTCHEHTRDERNSDASRNFEADVCRSACRERARNEREIQPYENKRKRADDKPVCKPYSQFFQYKLNRVLTRNSLFV